MLEPAGRNKYRVKQIRVRNGLGSDRIHALLFENGVLWAGGTNGSIHKLILKPVLSDNTDIANNMLKVRT